jgi:UDP-N-acetylglucosamine 1-carboxyvinyltransferase
MGAEIMGTGTSELTICGKQNLHAGIEYTIIPDRIEAGTFLMAGAITGGNITLINADPSHMDIVLRYLNEAGFDLDIKKNTVQIKMRNNSINPVNMTTEIYPGFPTDLQAQWMALMTKADGQSTIIEEIYTDRFTHISELSRFGAHIQLSGNKAEIQGMDNLKGAPVMSTDIRASASLIIAALSAEGESSISRIYHIDRGYDRIERKISKLAAKITRVKE